MKPLVFAAALVPFALLIWRGVTGNLSADPLAEITNETGIWTLRFVAVTLAITPLRRITGWNPIIRYRRMLGLFAFFYGTLHFLTYVVADRFASLDFPDGFVAWSTVVNLMAAIWEDVAKRPYITVGFIAFPGTAFSSPHHNTVFLRGNEPFTSRLLQPVLVDAKTNEVTATPKLPWYLAALLVSQPLHFGDYGGMPMQILWALLDIATIIVLGSGLYLWLKRGKAVPAGVPAQASAQGTPAAPIARPAVTAKAGS